MNFLLQCDLEPSGHRSKTVCFPHVTSRLPDLSVQANNSFFYYVCSSLLCVLRFFDFDFLEKLNFSKENSATLFMWNVNSSDDSLNLDNPKMIGRMEEKNSDMILHMSMAIFYNSIRICSDSFNHDCNNNFLQLNPFQQCGCSQILSLNKSHLSLELPYLLLISDC